MYTGCHVNFFCKGTQFSCSQNMGRNSGSMVPKNDDNNESVALWWTSLSLWLFPCSWIPLDVRLVSLFSIVGDFRNIWFRLSTIMCRNICSATGHSSVLLWWGFVPYSANKWWVDPDIFTWRGWVEQNTGGLECPIFSYIDFLFLFFLNWKVKWLDNSGQDFTNDGFWENAGACAKHHLKKSIVVSRGSLSFTVIPLGATLWKSHVPSPSHFSIRDWGLCSRMWVVKNLLFHCYFKSF